MSRAVYPLLVWLGLFASSALGESVQFGLRVPEGFEVTEFADARLANDIYTLTVDPRGRVVVAGRGYIRILVDDDGDGRADRAVPYADSPRDGAMGLHWEGDSLYATGDGGLLRFRDRDGDDHADGPPERIRPLKTGGEHAAHAIRRGADGWLYVLCGNNTGITAKTAEVNTSPIQEPVAGCVIRLSPDLKRAEIVADGFRNAYGMDFNSDGELFTFDSDNERCVSLPWYEPTRFYHVIPGGHHGWRTPQLGEFWRSPPYYPDVVPPVAYLGRGSPTGVVCYRHRRFPAKYRNGFFLLDWTFGRVYFAAPRRSGSSYTARPEVFLESVGDNGFAPTGAEVDPRTGDLFISIGGRGTRGAVYRVRHPGSGAGSIPVRAPETPVDTSDADRERLPTLLRSDDAIARLRALVALKRDRANVAADQLEFAIRVSWNDEDRQVRRAAADLLEILPKDRRGAILRAAGTVRERAVAALGSAVTDRTACLRLAEQVLSEKSVGEVECLLALRAVHRAFGDLGAIEHRGTIWEGYTLRQPVAVDGAILSGLRRLLAGKSADLRREAGRTLGALGDSDPESVRLCGELLTSSSAPAEDMHVLAVLARLQGPIDRELGEHISQSLLTLDEKMDRAGAQRESNWPRRVTELAEGLARRLPRLGELLVADPAFGRPEHLLLARIPGVDRESAARKFLARGTAEPDYGWSGQLIDFLAVLPPEQLKPVLRGLWDRGGLEDSILSVLARQPESRDRPLFLEGLRSPRFDTVRRCARTLSVLPPGDLDEVAALIRALSSLPDDPATDPARTELVACLKHCTGESLGLKRGPWLDWLAGKKPELAKRIQQSDGVDVGMWKGRLARIEWQGGDPTRGRGVFQRASCASCHTGSQALGPDLLGVTGRFSRDDLFTAVLQPSRDISTRYRTTLVATKSGKSYQGLMIYQAADGILLQTGAETTVRIPGEQIESMRPSPVSLMPAGLLDRYSDTEIADLYSYLKSLGKRPGTKR